MNCEMECVECHTCGCEYNVFQNNEYGYLNCCKGCGENRYEEEQEEKEVETPYLPEDIFSLILKIRNEEMKKDLYKKRYDNFVKDFNEAVYVFKDDILRDNMGTKGLYGTDCAIEWVDCKMILDKYELWELDCPVLSDVEENEPFNNLNYL
jgi:hypothetical protein